MKANASAAIKARAGYATTLQADRIYQRLCNVVNKVGEGLQQEISSGNVRGPSWAWIVGVLMTMVGAGVAAWMAVVWSQIVQTNQSLDRLNSSLMELKAGYAAQSDAIREQNAQVNKLWEKEGQDHEMIMADHYKLSVQDDWISAHIHADKAIKELHDGIK